MRFRSTQTSRFRPQSRDQVCGNIAEAATKPKQIGKLLEEAMILHTQEKIVFINPFGRS